MATLLDAAFGHPRGPLGRLGGLIMRRGNAEQERRAVALAALRPGATALLVGPGPGVGLAAAAKAVGPAGRVIGVDPSATMRAMAAQAVRTAEVRDGGAESTGCAESEVDAAISVNNVMLWRLTDGLAELHRVLRPGGLLVIAVHRHVPAADPRGPRHGRRRRGICRARPGNPRPPLLQPVDRTGRRALNPHPEPARPPLCQPVVRCPASSARIRLAVFTGHRRSAT